MATEVPIEQEEQIDKLDKLGIKIDEKAIEQEYLMRKQDMFDKYYGNKKKMIEYRVRMSRYKSAIEEKEFSYLDKNGNIQTGIYKFIKQYRGIDEDVAFLQLEEFAERLERMTKAKAGDRFVYANLPDQTEEEDKHYVETNNAGFNSHYYTQKDLKTLGKYGQKVNYLALQKKQPIRNILRGVLNVPIFLRNNITAPINRFVGSKIVAPIHKIVYPQEDPISNSSPYKNNRNHRYVARRDYFKEQGNGYFKSRFNALFKVEEGDEAVLRAGASDIKSSIKDKHIYEIVKKAEQMQIPEKVRKLDEHIRSLRNQLEVADSPEQEERIREELENRELEVNDLIKLYNRMEKDSGIHTAQTDAISEEQHAIASKEVNTRKITGVKMLAKGVVVRYVGPKIKDWLLEHTQKEVTSVIPGEDVPTIEEVWIDPVTEEVEIISAEKLGRVSVGDLLQGEKTVDYAVGLERKKDAVADLIYGRGIAITDGGKIISAADGNGFNISGISSIKLDPSLLDASGNLDLNAPIFDVIASVKNSVQGTNITANDIINEITSLTTIQEQTEALKSYFENISIAESMNSTGMFSGWNEKSSEIINLINSGAIKSTTQNVITDGYLDMVEKLIPGEPQTITELVDNERVVNALKTLGIIVKGGVVVGTVDDVYENLRKTTTEIKSKKAKPRNYTFDDGYSFKKDEVTVGDER